MNTNRVIMSVYAAVQFFKSAVDGGLRTISNGDYALLRLRSDMGISGKAEESARLELVNTLMREASYFGAKIGSATVDFLQNDDLESFDNNINAAIAGIMIEFGSKMTKEQRRRCVRYYESLDAAEGGCNE